MRRLTALIVLTAIVVSGLRVTVPVYAQSQSLFEPGGSFGGLFEGLREIFRGIFEGQPGEQGGAIIPQLPGAPTPGVNPPPKVNEGDKLKLSLEWDAVAVGPERADASGFDPFEVEHRRFIEENGCPALNESTCGVQVPPGEGCNLVPGSIEHALYGWCGQQPEFASEKIEKCPPGSATCIPFCDKGKDALGRCIMRLSPGPNTKTLPFAISNKYIRRDGYLYKCAATPCIANPSLCPDHITVNYMEFQTLIENSNLINLVLKVENLSDKEIKNIQIRTQNLTYSPEDEQRPLPHNLEYPVKVDASGYPPQVDWENGDKLVPERLPDLTGPLSNLKTLLGPFNLAQGERREFSLSDTRGQRCVVPNSVADPNPCSGRKPKTPALPAPGEVEPAPTVAQKPCACRQVVLHGAYPGVREGATCQKPLKNPTVAECRLYYGIVCNGGSCQIIDHGQGAVVCRRNNITVDGCAPPWCYEGTDQKPPPGRTIEDCPGGGLIPATAGQTSSLKLDLQRVGEALAFGCESACVDPPRIGAIGCGSMAPRDYDHHTSTENASCREREFKDVTALGGCGYEASSNNSVIGPIQFEATYGESSASRSVLLASLPVGGQILDDEGRPFGWPTTGRIDDEWGRTGKAQSEGPYRSDPSQLYSDYKYCPAGDEENPYVHTGIDIKPASGLVEPLEVYSTHAGWVTYVGDASEEGRPDMGWTIQIESDVTQDNIPDFVTRYKHLFPGSPQFDVQWKRKPFPYTDSKGHLKTRYALGEGVYVARNQLIGLMGDSGSPGEHQLDYEILYKLPTSWKVGDVVFQGCDNDPYLLACLAQNVSGFFFSQPRKMGNLVKGPVYSNP